MKRQWTIIAGLIFTLIIALFSALNIEVVSINYYFGEVNLPLILVILGSTLIGAIISSCFSAIRVFGLKRKVSLLQRDLHQKDNDIMRINEDSQQ